MRSKLIFKALGAAALVVLLACGGDSETSDATPTSDSSDPSGAVDPTLPEPTMGLSTQTIEHNGVTREYLLYVPTSYDGTQDVPLLFNFHGGTDSANNQLSYVDMRGLADSESFILIYPQAFLEDGETNWNTLRDAEISKLTSDDFGFVSAMIDALAATYRVDTTRVYATGYSNGAGMSYALACQLSDKIAAVAPVSGLMPIDGAAYPCSPTHPTSVLIVNGTADYSRPYEGYEGYLLSVDDAVSFWTNYNQTGADPSTTTFSSSGLSIERFDYVGGSGGAEVRLYKVNQGSHVWFDFPDEGVAHNQVIWDFLSRFDLSGVR